MDDRNCSKGRGVVLKGVSCPGRQSSEGAFSLADSYLSGSFFLYHYGYDGSIALDTNIAFLGTYKYLNNEDAKSFRYCRSIVGN